MAPTFNDLFPFGMGMCHMRVYERDIGEPIALALDLDDNPGNSVGNAAGALTERITSVFGPKCRLFIFFPDDDETWIEVLEEADGSNPTFRHDVSQAEVESLAGEEVAMPTAQECTAVDLGGPDHPLLALIPVEEELPSRIEGMQVVAVADLPWAHNPSKCDHFNRFEAIRGLYEESFDGHIPAGAHFFLSLDAEQFATCRYHHHDWAAIAAASVELLEGLAPDSDRDDVLSAAAEFFPEGPEREELGFLFSDPIKWSPSAASLINGQHRTCALKAAAAPLCVALTHGELHHEVVPGEPRRRAQSALAEYWAVRLGRDG